ncbi:MAG: hypothetical protein KDJ16_03945 [Hyphomicrobiales bacterium]|nr:hypothetical protein [Hyphomicrobiales bacterium]
MDRIGLALGLVKLLGSFVGWLHDRQMITAGQAETLAAEMKGQSDALKNALAAREAVRADAAVHPERVSDDDGFRRD